MRTSNRFAVVLAALAALSSAATCHSAYAATLTPVQRTSTIDIYPSGSRTYTGFGVFDDSMQAYMVGASQVSSLAPDAVHFAGEVTGGRLSQIGFTMGTSSLDVTFDVDTPTSFAIDSSFSAAVFHVQLQGPGVDLRSDYGMHATGQFVAGRYSLGLTLAQSAGLGDPIGSTNTGSGWLTMTIPEPTSLGLAAPLVALCRRRGRHNG